MWSAGQLFSAWTLAAPSKGAVSGEPLSQWVLRPGELSLVVGGSSRATLAAGSVTVLGPETPLSRCPAPLPNETPNAPL